MTAAGQWISTILQVVLSVASIWLGFWFYFKQQQEAQNERYKGINKGLDNLQSRISDVSSELQDIRGHLDSEIAELSKQVIVIKHTTSQTQSQVWASYDKMVDKVVTQSINVSDKLTLNMTKYRVTPSETKPDSEENK